MDGNVTKSEFVTLTQKFPELEAGKGCDRGWGLEFRLGSRNTARWGLGLRPALLCACERREWADGRRTGDGLLYQPLV